MDDHLHIQQRRKKILSWTAVGLWVVSLFIFSSLYGGTAAQLMQGITNKACSVLAAMAGDLSADALKLVQQLTPYALQAMGYMVLAVLCWNAFRLTGLGKRAAPALSLAAVSLFAVTDELHQIIPPGRVPSILDWCIDVGAALLILGGIWLFQLAWEKLPRLVNRETVSYVVFGVLTTIVNIVVYLLCNTAITRAGIMSDVACTLFSTTVAWIVAVLFAYVVNKWFVFQSKTNSISAALKEFGLFIAARLFSYGVDAVGMVLMVNVMHLGNAFSKIFMNVIVMIMNYFFSKWFIFNKEKKSSPSPDEPAG